MRFTGHYLKEGNINFFIPDPLPPSPPLQLNDEMLTLHGDAMFHLSKLNEVINAMPNSHSFIQAFLLKEALLSSAIEGIHTTLLDVYTQPLLDEKPNKNTQLVLNYTKALQAALDALKQHGLDNASEIIVAAHKELMELENDDHADPGNYRKHPVRVGNLIPPPPILVAQCMNDLGAYITTDHTQPSHKPFDKGSGLKAQGGVYPERSEGAGAAIPPLIKAGLVHVQFETIHPFLDGNGRIGRLLIVLMLVESGLLSKPILYPSYYFKKHQMEYYQGLDGVRTLGDFESWIIYYLTAIRDSSIDAYKRIKDLQALQERLTQRIAQSSAKEPTTKLRALSVLFSYPVISATKLSAELDIAYNTARQVITDFMELGFLVEENEQKRGKLFKFQDYLVVLEQSYDR